MVVQREFYIQSESQHNGNEVHHSITEEKTM